MNMPHGRTRFGLCLALAALPQLVGGVPTLADGFHSTYFRKDFYDDWEKLKPKLNQTIAGRSRTYVNGRLVPAPKQTFRDAVVQELIRILKYVDPYNDAADSPDWMHTEDGRMMARESAIDILHEIGARAALAVCEALTDAIRFETPKRKKGLEEIRAMQERQDALAARIGDALKRFPAAWKAYGAGQSPEDPEMRLLLAWQRLVMETRVPVERPKIRRPRGFRPRQPQAANHRPLPMDRYREIMMLNMMRRLPNTAGRIRRAVHADPKAREDGKIKTLLNELQTLQSSILSKISAFNRIDRPRGGKGPRWNLGGMAYDMIPCENYLWDLKTVLVRMGRDALPALRKYERHANREVARVARELISTIDAQKARSRPAGLQPAQDDAAVHQAKLALELWDSGDKRRQSAIARRALARLKARGPKAVPDILFIMGVARMKLQPECGGALAALTGQRFGNDHTAWKRWYVDWLAKQHKPRQPSQRKDRPERQPPPETKPPGKVFPPAPPKKTPQHPSNEDDEEEERGRYD